MARTWFGHVCATAALISACLLVPAKAQGVNPEANLLRARVVLACADDPAVQPKVDGYLLALYADNPDSLLTASQALDIRPATGASVDPAKSVFAALVIYVQTADGPKPLILRSVGDATAYYVDCAPTDWKQQRREFFPTLLVGAATEADKPDLQLFMERRIDPASRRAPLDGLKFVEPAPGEASYEWLPLPAGANSTFGSLVQSYTNRFKGRADFLNGFRGKVFWETIESATPVIKFQRSAQQNRAGDAEEAAPAAAPDGLASATVPRGPDPQSSAGQPLPQPIEARQKRRIRISLTGPAFVKVDFSQNNWIDTFGYCAEPVIKDANQPGIYSLDECRTDASGQIPLKIYGLEPIAIQASTSQSNAPIALNKLLRTAGFSTPYPATWQMSAREVVKVDAGLVEDVLKRPLRLQQMGVPGCDVDAVPTVTDLMYRSVTFPATMPCRGIDVKLAAALMGSGRPSITAGCRPGAAVAIAASAQGIAQCAVTAADIAKKEKRITLQWAPSFEPFDVFLPLTDGLQQAVDLDADLIRPQLRPLAVHSQPTERRTDAPIYSPVSVRYFTGTQPCSEAIKLASAKLPPIAEGGCQKLPTRMDIAYAIDRAASDPGVALDAFNERPLHSVDLAGPAVRFDAGRARLKLPVAFNPERSQQYQSEFARSADLLVKGVRIFTKPGCSDPVGPQTPVALFAGSGARPEQQWPVYGRVFDNEGRDLTNCAAAIVERGTDGRPFLTFDLKSTRAVGPRRVVVVARSQDLMDKRGFPKALETALTSFIQTAQDYHKRGAPLSPVDILAVSQDGTMRRVFSGEDAALLPQSARDAIAAMDRTAPKVPDLSLFRLQPEMKGAERIIVIMDGSTVSGRQASEVKVLGSDLGGGGLQFFLSSDNCNLWRPHAQQLQCSDLGALKQSEREDVMGRALIALLNQAGSPGAAAPAPR